EAQWSARGAVTDFARIPGVTPGRPAPVPAHDPGALARLKKPAAGLVASGIMYWVIVPAFFVMAFSGPVDLPFAKWPSLDDGTFHYLWVRMAILPAVAGFLLIFGGWKMRHGEQYWLCVLAACVPFAIW